RPGKTIAAQQESIARFDCEWSLDVDSHRLMRPQRAGDHIFRHVGGDLFLGGMSRSGHLPHEAVIERELLETAVTKSIDAAVAHVSRQRALRQDQQATACRAHPLEVDAVRTLGVYHTVGFANGLDDRFTRREVLALVIAVGYRVGSELAGKFTGSVSP